MDLKAARAKYHNQKKAAAVRGIGWELTFREWLEWWGDDLDNRGPRAWNLQMQRKLDQGPYALGNIVKGHPKQNTRTWVNVRRNNQAKIDAARYQAAIDAAEPVSDDYESEDESISAYFSRGQYDAVIRRCRADVLSGKGG